MSEENIIIHGKEFSREEVIKTGEGPVRKTKNVLRWLGVGLFALGLLIVGSGVALLILDPGDETWISAFIVGTPPTVAGSILFGLSFKKRDPFEYGKAILARRFPAPLGFDDNIIEVLTGDKTITFTKRPLQQMIVDSTSLQFQLLIKGRYSRIFSDVDIIDYEIRVDNELVVNSTTRNKKGVGKALVGGALFGDAGLVAGAVAGNSKSSTTSVQKEIHHYTLVLKVNDILRPSFVIEMADVNVAEDVAGTLLILLKNRKDSKPAETIEEKPSKKEDFDKFAEIKKYKELLDSGIISKEEFEQKKKELL